jgi:hypothetical protein
MGHLHPRRRNGAEKAELWRRWRQGESLQTIGRALGWVTKCMHDGGAGAGGVPPRPRRRSRLALTGAEREEISRGLANGASFRAVSRGLGRAASTVSREVRRMAAAASIVRPSPTRARGRGVDARRSVAWPRDPRYATSWRPNWRSNGRRSKSPAGSDTRILTIPRCTHLSSPEVRGTSSGRRHRRRRVHSRASRHGRRSRRARPLGRGSPRRRAPLARGHVGGTTLALRVSDSTGGTRYADRRARADAARPTTPGGINGDADLGSRLRARAPSRVLDRHGRARLLLRPAESVAARDEREYQRAPPAILSHGHEPVGLFPAAPRCDRPPPQHAASQNARLSHPGGYTRRHRCIDRLNPPDYSLVSLCEIRSARVGT